MANSCNGCGLCCKLFLINLNKQEYQSGKFQTIFAHLGPVLEYKLAKVCGANFLAKKPDGSCIYLEGTQCGIHETRPQVCRDFFCTSLAKKFSVMVQEIKAADNQKISSVSQIEG